MTVSSATGAALSAEYPAPITPKKYALTNRLTEHSTDDAIDILKKKIAEFNRYLAFEITLNFQAAESRDNPNYHAEKTVTLKHHENHYKIKFSGFTTAEEDLIVASLEEITGRINSITRAPSIMTAEQAGFGLCVKGDVVMGNKSTTALVSGSPEDVAAFYKLMGLAPPPVKKNN